MITKEELKEMLRRRNDEGKSVSLASIDDEGYSEQQLRNSANKHFGGWMKARNEIVGIRKYSHKPEMSRKEIVEELRRLQAEGHSMKTADFDPWFYRRIVNEFGGYIRAKKELNIDNKRRPGSGPKSRGIGEVIEELKSVHHKIKTKGEYNTKYRHLADYSRRHFGDAYKIFELAKLSIPKNTSRKRRAYYWTDCRIRAELEEAVRKNSTTTANALRQKGYNRLVNAVERHYGTWNAGLVALGYEVAYEFRDPNDNLTKEETKEKVMNALSTGTKPTRGALEKEIKGLARSIKVNFDGIGGLKEYCGFCAVNDRPLKQGTGFSKYRPDLTTVEGIKREITRMWYIGSPMNYSYVKERRRHLLDATNERMGSWRKAVESIGLDYSAVSVTTNTLSECGTEFENIFAEILSELGYEYIREGEKVDEMIPDFKLKPDFILPNWRWIDCKLSEWTDIREMLKRYYSEHPNGITIVYLRGRNRRINRGRKWKYEHVSVYQFTKQLPKERRSYFENKLRNLSEKADERKTPA